MSDAARVVDARVWMVAVALAGVALGVGGGLLLRGDADAPAPAAQPPASAGGAAGRGDLARAVDALRAELAAEREAGRARDEELARLRAHIEEITGEDLADGEPDAGDAPAAAERGRPWFDASALLNRGMPPAEVARLRERFEEHELELLYLRDEARRDGRMARFANERRNLEIELREDLGPEGFDAILFATGRPNRVVLTDVLSNSPAANAGARRGDVVVAYDGLPVFAAQELQQATAEGQAGRQVALDLLRDGRELRIYVPRGPLGARLRPTRVPPQYR